MRHDYYLHSDDKLSPRLPANCGSSEEQSMGDGGNEEK